MNTARLDEIREAEKRAHIAAYTSHELFAAGSWLAKPVKTVLELLTMYEGCSEFRALDLGCGVGRNSIPVAQAFQQIGCRVDCVDILPLAIEKLCHNAAYYGVENYIHGIVSAIDQYRIEPESYDLIMAVSALEHVASAKTFLEKLVQIRDGIRKNGMVCLIVNSGVREQDKATGKILPAQFEVNLETAQLGHMLEQVFGTWETVKRTVVHQKYDIPRECGMAQVETDVLTFVVRRK